MNLLAIAATIAEFQLNDCSAADIMPGTVIRSGRRYAVIITAKRGRTTTLSDGCKIHELWCTISDTAYANVHRLVNVYIGTWCESKWCLLCTYRKGA